MTARIPDDGRSVPVVVAPGHQPMTEPSKEWLGVVGGVAGIIIVATGLVSLDFVPEAIGVDAGLYFVVIAFVSLGVFVAGAAAQHRMFRHHRRMARKSSDFVLTVGELRNAPTALATPMRDARVSVNVITGSRAVRMGYLTDVNVDAALWDLAQHVKVGAHLHGLIHNFNATMHPDDQAQINVARVDYAATIAHVKGGADRLRAIARSVSEFDEKLAETERRAALDARLESEQQRRAVASAEHAAQVEIARIRLHAIEPALGNVAAHLSEQLHAYNDTSVGEVADRVPRSEPCVDGGVKE